MLSPLDLEEISQSEKELYYLAARRGSKEGELLAKRFFEAVRCAHVLSHPMGYSTIKTFLLQSDEELVQALKTCGPDYARIWQREIK